VQPEVNTLVFCERGNKKLGKEDVLEIDPSPVPKQLPAQKTPALFGLRGSSGQGRRKGVARKERGTGKDRSRLASRNSRHLSDRQKRVEKRVDT